MSNTMEMRDKLLARAIGLTGKSIRKRFDKNLAEQAFEINGEQAIVLIHLKVFGGISQQQIAEQIGRDKAATTRIIDYLEKKQLVKRVPDMTDRRRNKIFLAKRGEDIYRRLIQIAHITEQQATKGIDKRDLAICRAVLEKVRENLID